MSATVKLRQRTPEARRAYYEGQVARQAAHVAHPVDELRKARTMLRLMRHFARFAGRSRGTR